MITFDEAQKRIQDIATPLGTETIPIDKAPGRILADDVSARLSSPAMNVSAMDGYGVSSSDLDSFPKNLPVTRESYAGSPPQAPIQPGECIRIFTGAPIPDGVDRVIIQENVTRNGNSATINEAPTGGTHIRAAGSDFNAGDTLLPSGTVLNWRAMTTLASADRVDVSVYRRINATILATGDELAAPGFAHETPGAIPESVSLGVAAFLQSHDVNLIRSQRLPDQIDILKTAANDALALSDIVIVTGGASVGERDYARTMFEDHDLDFVFSKVAIKPGKPVWMARTGNRIIVGLPGNPTSALVTTRLMLAPLLYGLQGKPPQAAIQFQQVETACDLPASGARETFGRGYLLNGRFSPVTNQDSGVQGSLANTTHLVRRLPSAPAISAGETVQVLPF